MLFFFRQSQPLALPFLLLYALVVYAVPLWQSAQGPFMGLLDSLAAGHAGVSMTWAFLFGGMAPEPAATDARLHPIAVLAGALLVLGQAVLVSRSLRTIKGLAAPGYLPALFYLLFAAALGAGFNAPTAGTGFLLLAFNRLIRAYGPEPADSLLFEAGFWVGLAAITVPAFLAFLPFSLFMASNLRPVNFREFGVLLAGFLAVIILLLAGLYVANGWPTISAANWSLYPQFPQPATWTASRWLQVLPAVAVALASAVTAGQRNRKSLIQVRKLSTWTAVFGLFAVLVWLAAGSVAAAAVFPLAFFTAYWIHSGGWPRTWELAHATLLALLIIGQLM
ncbi:MAG: hypothetical protein GC205_01365 [Bacteroidetes bacterium]|nr:hypothetical protein [Bacteroidota bacterium]